MEKVGKQVPTWGDRPPPLPDVVYLLTAELSLLDRMRTAGVDTTAAEGELSGLLEFAPPQ